MTDEIVEEKPNGQDASGLEKAAKSERPEGLPEDERWEPVDFENDDRGEIEKRFRRVYRSMSEHKEALKAAAQDQKVLVSKILQLEDKLTTREKAERMAELKKEKASALDEGNNERVVELDDQMAELRQAPVKKEAPPEQPARSTWFTPEREQALVSWASEIDEDGSPVRPWAQQGHPKNARAVEITNAVINDPEFDGAEINEILSEVDRLMAPKKKQTQAAVMTGGTERPQKKPELPKLSEGQLAVARRMGVKPEDYAKALKES